MIDSKFERVHFLMQATNDENEQRNNLHASKSRAYVCQYPLSRQGLNTKCGLDELCDQSTLSCALQLNRILFNSGIKFTKMQAMRFGLIKRILLSSANIEQILSV